MGEDIGAAASSAAAAAALVPERMARGGGATRRRAALPLPLVPELSLGRIWSWTGQSFCCWAALSIPMAPNATQAARWTAEQLTEGIRRC